MHKPVLLNEILQYLNPQPNENFIDCTLGFVGHSKAILEKNGPNGKVLGIEIDPEVWGQARDRLGTAQNQRLVVVNDSYANLKEIVEKENFKPVHGILFDLGMSSWDIDESGRGFSFKKDEPLDMRYDTEIKNDLTAERILNEWPQAEVERILWDYGEEKWANRIARKVVEVRPRQPIKSTFQLIDIIKKSIPLKFRHSRIHFATRTFQALRIAVNRELENLEKALPQALEVLEKNGRIGVISFHSLEDRIVKNFFRDNFKKDLIKVLTKKPVMAQLEEIANNSRAKGAKLRAAEKI